MKSPEPLSPAARRLLELGSQVDPPTAEQTERMDRALEPLFRASHAARIASGESRFRAPRGARPASQSLRQLFGLGGGKLAFGALAATAATSFWLGRFSAFDEPSTHAAQLPGAASAPVAVVTPPAPSEAPAPARAAPTAPDAAALAPRAAPSPIVTSAPPAAGVAMSPPAGSHAATAAESSRAARSARGRQSSLLGLAAEIERLARAEAALRQGRAARALSHLQQHAIVHLSEQAAVLRAIAECELGVANAARRARSVLQRWPISAFQARIRDACGL